MVQQSLRNYMLHLFFLSALSFAQPIFDLTGRNPEFFVAHDNSTTDVVILIFIVMLVIPALLVGVEICAAIASKKALHVTHAIILGLLVGTAVLPAFDKIAWLSGIAVVGLSGLTGIVAALAFAGSATVRSTLTLISPLALAIPVLFLLTLPLFKLEGDQDQERYALDIEADIPIVLIVFDEFRLSDLLGESGDLNRAKFPGFARLAADGYWFPNATTVSPDTTAAVPSILTGRYPQFDRVKLATAREHPINLFSLLSGSYLFNIHEPITSICQMPKCLGSVTMDQVFDKWKIILSDLLIIYLNVTMPEEFRTGIPSISFGWRNFGQNATAQPGVMDRFWYNIDSGRDVIFSKFSRNVIKYGKGTLNFLHIMLPHHPYEYFPSGRVYLSPDRPDGLDLLSGKNIWADQPILSDLGRQRYIAQVQFVDKLLGDFLDKLHSAGLYDQSLIIVMADHGVSFQRGSYLREVTPKNVQDILRIPMFMKTPFQKHGVLSPRFVETIDVLPTILDILDAPSVNGIDGSSMVGPLFPNREIKVVRGSRDGQIISFPYEKIISQSLGRTGPALEIKSDCMELIIGKACASTMVGRPLAHLVVGGPASLTVEVDQLNGFPFELSSDTIALPAYISGRVVGANELDAPIPLAFTVNDTVYAVTSTLPKWRNGNEFRAMLPEFAFQQGLNTLRVFRVEQRPASDPLLFEVSLGSAIPSHATVVESDGVDKAIVLSDGQRVPIVPNAVPGAVDKVEKLQRFGRRGLKIGGWAIDGTGRDVASAIVVFQDSRFIAAKRPVISRPDIMKAYNNDRVLLSGFEFHLLLEDFDPSRLRIYAISPRGFASKLGDYTGKLSPKTAQE